MVWDQHCLVCGGPLFLYTISREGGNTDAEIAKDTRLRDKGVDWLTELLLINNREEKKPGGEMDSNTGGEYDHDDTIYTVLPMGFKKANDGEYGIIMHQSCFNCVKKHLYHEIKFADVVRDLSEYDSVLERLRYYPVAKKYFDQFSSIVNVSDDDEYLYSDPMGDSKDSKKNRNMLIKVWRPLVKRFKKHTPRPSPAESAKNYGRGKKRTGFDGSLWRVVGGRWKRDKR